MCPGDGIEVKPGDEAADVAAEVRVSMGMNRGGVMYVVIWQLTPAVIRQVA